MRIFWAYRKPLLAGTLLLSVALGFGLSRLGVSFSFEDYFPESHPELVFYEQHRAHFPEPQKRSIFLALQSPYEDIYHRDFLRQADQLFSQIAALPGIDSAYYATALPRYLWDGLRLGERFYLPTDSATNWVQVKKSIKQDRDLTAMFISRDERYVCGYFLLEESIFDRPERELVCQQLDRLLAQQNLTFQVSGIPYIRYGYTQKIAQEMGQFGLISILLVALLMFLLLRKLPLVLLFLFCLILGIVWTMGLMGWTGQSLDLMSNMLIPIIFVVGASDVIHLSNHYLQIKAQGHDTQQSLHKTILDIGKAVFLTSLTTAIGFASLLLSPISPIRNFGLFAAFGVMATYLLSMVLIVSLLSQQQINLSTDSLYAQLQGFFQPLLKRLYSWGQKFGGSIISLFLLLGILAAFGIRLIPPSTYLIEDIGQDDPIRLTANFFEEQFYGTRTFELALEAPAPYLLTDPNVLGEIKKIETFLHSQARFSPFLSPASLLAELNYIQHFSRPQHKQIPKEQSQIDELLDLALAQGESHLLAQVMDSSRQKGRIRANMGDIGSVAFDSLRVNLLQYIAQNIDASKLQLRLTGHSYILELNLKYIRNSLAQSLLIACMIIALIMALLYRSWQLLGLSLVVNLFPLLMMGGMMGWLGMALTTSSSVVFVIAFGIVVDDTIHFLSRYRQEIDLGASPETALKTSLEETGQAMLMTSLFIAAGFGVMMSSEFGGIFSTGFLTVLALVWALLADLLLLPVLLRRTLKQTPPEPLDD
ncbi:MAG: efflux RND transporter permease subunit [Bacteroidota bacterium]